MHSTILHITTDINEKVLKSFGIECNQVSPYCDYIGDEFSKKELEEWFKDCCLPKDMFEVSKEKNGIIKLTYKQYPEEWFNKWYNDFRELADKITIDHFKKDSIDLFSLTELIRYRKNDVKVYSDWYNFLSLSEWITEVSTKPIGTEFYALTAIDYHY